MCKLTVVLLLSIRPSRAWQDPKPGTNILWFRRLAATSRFSQRVEQQQFRAWRRRDTPISFRSSGCNSRSQASIGRTAFPCAPRPPTPPGSTAMSGRNLSDTAQHSAKTQRIADGRDRRPRTIGGWLASWPPEWPSRAVARFDPARSGRPQPASDRCGMRRQQRTPALPRWLGDGLLSKPWRAPYHAHRVSGVLAIASSSGFVLARRVLKLKLTVLRRQSQPVGRSGQHGGAMSERESPSSFFVSGSPVLAVGKISDRLQLSTDAALASASVCSS
jgi:hypothetical protein